jgi:Rrf2 family protein
MIKISKKADYAVLIMASLAMRQVQHVEEQGEDAGATPLVCAHEIATQAGLSRPLCANLLKTLTRANLLQSVRGAAGGYRLGQPMESITLTQILEAVEGPMQLVACAADEPLATAHSVSCGLSENCPSRSAMRVVHERVAKLMQEIHLPELLRLEKRASLGTKYATRT